MISIYAKSFIEIPPLQVQRYCGMRNRC